MDQYLEVTVQVRWGEVYESDISLRHRCDPDEDSLDPEAATNLIARAAGAAVHSVKELGT